MLLATNIGRAPEFVSHNYHSSVVKVDHSRNVLDDIDIFRWWHIFPHLEFLFNASIYFPKLSFKPILIKSALMVSWNNYLVFEILLLKPFGEHSSFLNFTIKGKITAMNKDVPGNKFSEFQIFMLGVSVRHANNFNSLSWFCGFHLS